MKNTFLAIVGVATITSLVIFSCSKSSSSTTTVDCSGVSATWSADVQPIINSSCATTSACHAAGSSNSGGAFTSYSAVFNRRSNIASQVSSGAMPQGSTLSSTQKNKILCWIQSGAPNN